MSFSKSMSGILVLNFLATIAGAQMRVKDVARVGGARNLDLVGYGLVVGLKGTGDKPGTSPTAQSAATLLQKLGVNISAQELAMSNVAAVVVTARVPSYAAPGATLDAAVSSLGNATGLDNGTLLMTTLAGIDGKSYAVAQGRLSRETGGGEDKKTGGGASALLQNGVMLERPLPAAPLEKDQKILVSLERPDLVTAERIAQAVRENFKIPCRAADPSRIDVDIPEKFQEDPVGFAARLENLPVEADEAPRVVVDETSGAVIAGKNANVLPVAISHGSLKIEIGGVDGSVLREASVATLVQMLHGVGAKPKDVVTIFKMLKRSGALKAELLFM